MKFKLYDLLGRTLKITVKVVPYNLLIIMERIIPNDPDVNSLTLYLFNTRRK